jgi:hypothetical protein
MTRVMRSRLFHTRQIKNHKAKPLIIENYKTKQIAIKTIRTKSDIKTK